MRHVTNKTYQEVWDEHQSYVSCVLTTNQESDSPHWRLRRLAQWFQMQKHQRALLATAPSPSKTSGKAESSVGSFSMVSQKGYPEEKTSPNKTQMMQDLAELEQMRQAAEQDPSGGSPGGGPPGPEGRDEPHRGSPQEPQGDVSALVAHEDPLSEESALTLAKIWHVRRNPFRKSSWLSWRAIPTVFCPPKLNADLVRGQRSVVCQIGMQQIRQLRPVHLCISCDGAPFLSSSSLQRRPLNRQPDLIINKLRQNWCNSGEEAWKIGTEVYWELSQRCQAWNLDFVQGYEQRHGLKKVSCNGCTMGLRTRDGKTALCKAWNISTKNAALLQHMNLRCQKNHPKGKCERGESAHTARFRSQSGGFMVRV